MMAAIAFIKQGLKFFTKEAWGWIIAILMALLLAGTCSYNGWQDRREAASEAKAERENAAADRAAVEGAGEARLQDYKDTQQNKEKLNDALASIPDDVPSAHSLALACQRLRNAGSGEEQLPTACRPPAQGQAGAEPRLFVQRALPDGIQY